MITDNGVELVSKYLAGQASSYASHIVIGCGPRPLLNNTFTKFASSATVSSVAGAGPYTATVTISGETLAYIEPGDVIQSQYTTIVGPFTGTLGNGVITVTAITGPKTFTVSSTLSISAGTVGTLSVKTNIDSKTFGSKTKLDFEMARYPITSRSYIVEPTLTTSTGLVIIGDYSIRLNFSSHTFTKGDTIYVTDADTATGPGTPIANVEVNGLYKITSTTTTTVDAIRADTTFAVIWDNSLWNTTAMVGYAYNQYLINITAYTKQISLTAEMSDIYPYDISEIGLYSLGSNQYTNSDSRILLNFTSGELWQYATYDTLSPLLDPEFSFDDVASANIAVPITSAFFASSNDGYWSALSSRVLSQQKPRYLNQALIIPGNKAELSTGFTFIPSSQYASLANPGINLDKASASDEIILAFSIIDAVANPTSIPTSYYIRFEFVSSDGVNSANILFGDTSATCIVPANRYIIASTKISQIVATSGFDWKDVASVNIYASIEVSGTPTGDYAFALDGLRYENITTENPLYALTAYSVSNSSTGSKITKQENSNDFINFRLDLTAGL